MMHPDDQSITLRSLAETSRGVKDIKANMGGVEKDFMGQTRIIIRPLRMSDTDDIHALMHMPNVLWGTFLLPSTSIDEWKRIIERWLSDERMHVFVAELEGKVAGIISLEAGRGRLQHVGNITLAVHDQFQGQGIGKMLMLTAIDLADNWLNLLRLELDVYIDNDRAVRLYRSFDFEIEGRKRGSAFRSGKYIDSYLMARLRSQQQQNEYAEVLTQVPISPEPPAPSK